MAGGARPRSSSRSDDRGPAVPSRPEDQGAPSARTGWLTVGLAGCTGTALLAYAVFLVVEWALGRSVDSAGGAALVVGFFVLWAALVLAATRAAARHRRWSRGALLSTYLLLFAVAWDLTGSAGLSRVVGICLFGLAATGLYSVVRPSFSATLG